MVPADQALMLQRLGALRRPQSYAWSHLGIPVEPISDPVLRLMPTEWPDWREYDAMMRFQLVADPWTQLTSAVLEEPFEIVEGQPGRKSNQSTRRLAKNARWMWAQMGAGVGRPDPRPTLLRRMTNASLYGWLPCQVIPERREGMWAPVRVIPHDPWHFRFAYDPPRRLLYLPTEWSADFKMYSESETQLGWLCIQVGDLLSSYGLGKGSTIWTAARVARAIYQHFYSNTSREWGMMMVEPREGTSQTLAEEVEALRSDLAIINDYLNNQNILVQSNKFKVSWLDQSEFIEDGVKLMDHLATGLRIMIQGGHLTSATVGAGPVGSSATQERRLWAYQGQVLAESIEAPISSLLATWLWVNEGVELDPEDLPQFVSRFRLKPAAADVDRLWNMGAAFRGRRLAELYGAAALVGTEAEIAEEADEFALKKSAAAPKVATPPPAGDPGRPTDPELPVAGDEPPPGEEPTEEPEREVPN